MSENDAPLPLFEDDDTGDRFLVYATDSGIRIDLKVDGDTFWASQNQIAEAFAVTRQNVSLHLINIFRDGELSEAAVCKESLRTGPDGKRYVTKLYNLNALISVGYRVGGKLGTAFRLWSTERLFQYLTKGFVIDAKRLKESGDHDRITELRDIIRDIRASEANVYADLRRICALCQDYDPASDDAREFYIRMQAKLYWATVSQTPSMIVQGRADASAPHMGLMNWSRQEIRQADALTAKNYLAPAELKELNRLTVILLDVFEDQLDVGRLTLMTEAARLLDQQLRGLSRAILQHGGSVSHTSAEAHAKAEYRKFDAARRAERVKQALRDLADLSGTEKALPRAGQRRPNRRSGP